MPQVHWIRKPDQSKHRYYLCSEVQTEYKCLNKGCGKNAKKFIDTHGIPAEFWIYARADEDGNWFMADTFSTKVDKRMISVRYFLAHLDPNREIIDDDDDEDEIDDCQEEIAGTGRQRLPKEIKLTSKEAFRNQDGAIMKIRVVGARDVFGCYFNVGDVDEAFGMKRLADTITHSSSGYVESTHYRIFDVSRTKTAVNHGKTATRNVISEASKSKKIATNDTRNETHYLTYLGLTRALFGCNSKTSEHFQTWAIQILFTAQMGSSKQRIALAKNLVGADLEMIKSIQGITSGAISCIYLILLGTVGDLREAMSIDDTHADAECVYKFGQTNDLARRTAEHTTKYGKIPGAKVRVVYYGYVDEDLADRAEGEIKRILHSHKMAFQHRGSRELVIISPDSLKNIKKDYDRIIELNRGTVASLGASLEVMEAKHAAALTKAEMDVKDAEHRSSLLEKELSLAEARLTLASSQHRAEILEYKLANAIAGR